MTPDSLSEYYRGYIACLNRRDWAELHRYVAADVRHNGKPLGLAGYRAMLEDNCRDIPDLHFAIGLLVCEGAHIASRLVFDCTPVATFLGLPVNGRHVSFTENVFYRLRDGKIDNVWSILDKAAIEAQLR